MQGLFDHSRVVSSPKFSTPSENLGGDSQADITKGKFDYVRYLWLPLNR